MNKNQLFDFFDKKISATVIQQCGDDWVIKGKWSIVSVWEDGLIDIWLCDTKNLPLGRLGERKLSNIINCLEKSTGRGVVHRLTGEAYTQTSDKNVILFNLDLLGILKKRQISSNSYNLPGNQHKKSELIL